MRKAIWICGMSLAMPLLAQGMRVETELHGLPLEVERLGMADEQAGAAAGRSSFLGVPAARVTNHGETIVSCQFHAGTEPAGMAVTAAFAIDPGGQEVMRIPDEFAEEPGALVLSCRPAAASR